MICDDCLIVSRIAVLSPNSGSFYATLLIDDNPIYFTLLDMSGTPDDQDEWVESLDEIRNTHRDLVQNIRTRSI